MTDKMQACAQAMAAKTGGTVTIKAEAEKKALKKPRRPRPTVTVEETPKVQADVLTVKPTAGPENFMVPVETPEPKPEPSLLDEIIGAGDSFAGSKVAEAISMANTILTNTKAVTTFVNAMLAADALAIQKLGFDQLKEDIRTKWYGLTLKQVELQLQKWAKDGDTAANTILNTLAAFKKSVVDVVDPLWQLFTEVVRPAQNVRTFMHLSQFLLELFDKGLVDKLTNRPHYPEKAVVLGKQPSWVGYLPAAQFGKPVPMIEAGWVYVKEAEARAKQTVRDRQQKFDELKAEDTGLTPSAAKDGVEGKILVNFNAQLGRGVLLHINGSGESNGRGLCVRVLYQTGTMARRTGWMGYNNPRYLDDETFQAFEAWKKKG